ncbi:MAG: TolC family protein [Stenotrophomonas maltophilia]
MYRHEASSNLVFLCLGLVCAPAWAENNQQLTLDAAIERVAQGHPELRLIEGQRRVLDARAEIAAQRPQMTAGLELENVLGSGSYKGADQAELSVSLAGTLERGGKLDARRVLASANIDQLAPQREMARLDLLAETARRYLVIAGAVQQQRIAKLDITHRQRAVDAARRRHQAGGAPESVVLTAQSSLAEAELDRDSAAQAERAARQSLSALWNSTTPAAGDVTGDPLVLPAAGEFAAFSEQLTRSPELALLQGEARVRESELRLARTASRADIGWQLGARRFQDSDDTALFAGISLGLGSSARAAPGIRAAEAELALIPLQREALQVRLHAAAAQAFGEYQTSRLEAARLGSDVLPRLARAEKSAAAAWAAGATSYLEWAQLQDQQAQAMRRQLQAALAAQSALIELQRLTGQPIIDSTKSPSSAQDPTSP